MFPEVAVTVTIEVPGVTGVDGAEEVVDAPLHPPRVRTKASSEIDPPKIPTYFALLLRLRHSGKSPASPSGKRLLMMTTCLLLGPFLRLEK
jgi:hypothetical protein